MAALVERSKQVIRDGQAPSGAYVASPTFAPYRFSWFRDGSWIADAMSRVGEEASAEAFLTWAAGVIRANPAGPWDARYTLEGEREHTVWPEEGEDVAHEWPKYQLDGIGLWLWALREHCDRYGKPLAPWQDAVDHAVAYLHEHWRDPCVDWWEEREGVHAATLACLKAGLDGWGADVVDLSAAEERLDASQLVLLVLGIGDVDVSPLVSPGGGVRRNLEDTYYGGGEWLLLTAMLGWAEAMGGDSDAGRGRLEWMEAKATPEGYLPEQVQDHLLAPETYELWFRRWGPPPSPLLWSHAMYLTLAAELGEA